MNKILKAGVGYTIANILIKGIGFLTLPLFARLLTPEDFGMYNIFMSYQVIVFCIVGFALHSSLRSANREFEINEYTSSIVLLYILQLVAGGVFLVLFQKPLESWTDFGGNVLVLILLGGFGSSLIELYNDRVALAYAYRKYMAVMAAAAFCNVGLSLVLMLTVFNDDRFFGRVLGASLSLFAVGVFVIGRLWYLHRPMVNRTYWSFGLRYSIPVVFHGLFQMVLMQTGTIIIQKMVSGSAAGMYALGLSFLSIVTVLIGSMSTVWSTYFYDCMADPSAVKQEKIRQAARMVSFFFALLTMGLSCAAPEILLVLGGARYAESAYSVYGILICSYLIAAYNLIVVGEYYAKKTHLLVFCTLAGAVCCVLFNWFGIRLWGYQSVAYTTSLAYIVYVGMHWCLCRRLLGFSVIRLRDLAVTLGCSYAVAGINFMWTDCLWGRFGMALLILAAAGIFVKHHYADLRQMIRR